MSSPYLAAMIARLVTVLAILAITLVTTAASVHAARMNINSAPPHATQHCEMLHAAEPARLACEGEQHGGSVDAGICDLVCAGFSAIVTWPAEQSGHAYGPASHDLPAEARHASRAPGLTERPPKHRFL